MRTLLSIAVMAAASLGLVLVLLYFWQSSLILLPGVGGGSPDVLLQCGHGSARWQDKGQYRGKICEPAGPAKGTFIVYHGNAGTIDDRAILAGVLAARGFRVVLVEYPGFGERDGRASVNGVLAASLEDFRTAAAKWPAPIYLLGESFGAGVAAEAARKHPDMTAGVVLITPWDSLVNVVNSKFFLPVGFLLQQRFDTVEALAEFPGKVVIVAAERDDIVPASHARALAKTIAAAAYLEIRGAGHNDWPAFMTRKDWDWVIESLVKPQ